MTLTTLLMIVVFGVFFYLMMKSGGGCCGGHDHGGEGKHGDHDSHGGKDGEDHTHHHLDIETSENGTGKDQVCGMEIKDDSIVSSHLGRTFHFCSEQCKKLFDLDPNKYAGA